MASFSRTRVGFVVVCGSLLVSGIASAATIPTATFENLRGQFLGFDPFTDPLSGINFYNVTGGGLGASYFNATSSSFPSLYHDNTVLVQNSPQSGGTVVLGGNFSVHGALPTAGQTLDIDVLYSRNSFTLASQGAVYLIGYDSAGRVVARGETSLIPTTITAFLQTHLTASATSSSIVSFDVIASNLSTAYDNFAVKVPEPTGLAIVACGVTAARRRRSAASQ